MTDYHINVFYSEDGGGYIADIPDLKYCSAFENTPAEAVQEVQKARDAWLESAVSTENLFPPRVTAPPFINLPEAGA